EHGVDDPGPEPPGDPRDERGGEHAAGELAHVDAGAPGRAGLLVAGVARVHVVVPGVATHLRIRARVGLLPHAPRLVILSGIHRRYRLRVASGGPEGNAPDRMTRPARPSTMVGRACRPRSCGARVSGRWSSPRRRRRANGPPSPTAWPGTRPAFRGTCRRSRAGRPAGSR